MTDATLPTLAITGSTGAVGGMVARDLAARGVPQRLIVRDLSRAPQLPGAVAVAATYADRQAATAALAGVETLLMVSAGENEKRLDEHRAFVASASDAGVTHVVYTSFFGAAPDATFTLGRDHYVTEQLIEATGIDHTFLRDNLYLDFLDAMVGDDGVIRGPAGDGLLAGVARADVARVAVEVLLDYANGGAAHRNATYHLTGPEALTMRQIAAILSEVRGTEVSFHDETLPEAYASREKWGAPGWQNDAWVSTYTSIASGEMADVSGDVEAVTGRRPLSLRELLHEQSTS